MINPSNYKILIVDDDEDIRNSLSRLLSLEGFHTIHAKNGLVALDYLEAQPDQELPNLILLDYMMPVMTGDEFCLAKKASKRLRDIPVVVMTANGNLMKVIDRVEQGAQGYLSKPMELDSIIHMIEYLLSAGAGYSAHA